MCSIFFFAFLKLIHKTEMGACPRLSERIKLDICRISWSERAIV